VQGGYRAPLFHLAQADKKKVTFIGRLSDGPDKVDNVTFPKNREGHFAMSIEWLTDSKNMPDSVIQPAHIVLLHAGTNNRTGQPADAAKKIEALIDKILAAAPSALPFVSTIIPCGDNGPEVAFVLAYDPLIPPRGTAGQGRQTHPARRPVRQLCSCNDVHVPGEISPEPGGLRTHGRRVVRGHQVGTALERTSEVLPVTRWLGAWPAAAPPGKVPRKGARGWKDRGHLSAAADPCAEGTRCPVRTAHPPRRNAWHQREC
jgi:hypothetical protein